MLKLIPLILLVSCQSTDLTGAWTAKVGPFNSTFIFYANQQGKFCYSGRGQNIVERANYEGGIIYTEGGYQAEIISVDDALTVQVDADGVKEYEFLRDDKLTKASWYCRRELH
jgi:hypothetical protein